MLPTVTLLVLLAPPAVESAADAGAREDRPRFGFVVDVGLPDGAAVGVQIKAAPDFKLELAGLTNGVGFGVRAGAGVFVLPKLFRTFRPVVSADVGSLFQGDASWLPGVDPAVKAALAQVSYFFCSAAAGFELGSPNVAFVFKLGVAYVAGKLPSLTVPLPNSGALVATGIVVSGLIPSAKVGLSVAFD